MLSIKRNFYKSETRIRIYATTAHDYGIIHKRFSLQDRMKKANQCNYSCKKKTNVTQTSLFPCPTEPVPGVQIVGMVERDVSEKKGGGGASKGTRSLLIFFPLSYFAPNSTIRTPATGYVPERKLETLTGACGLMEEQITEVEQKVIGPFIRRKIQHVFY